jgi:hypothetical protein
VEMAWPFCRQCHDAKLIPGVKKKGINKLRKKEGTNACRSEHSLDLAIASLPILNQIRGKQEERKLWGMTPMKGHGGGGGGRVLKLDDLVAGVSTRLDAVFRLCMVPCYCTLTFIPCISSSSSSALLVCVVASATARYLAPPWLQICIQTGLL